MRMTLCVLNYSFFVHGGLDLRLGVEKTGKLPLVTWLNLFRLFTDFRDSHGVFVAIRSRFRQYDHVLEGDFFEKKPTGYQVFTK